MFDRRFISLLSILLCTLVLMACGGDKPPKKGRTILLATEYDDARVGSEQSKAVAAQMGILDDAALNSYVSSIGEKLLRGVPRRGFDYQFSVVDQVEPNAFALPGGYIFISRGLLALANNEDELACVIGHEITHAAHRHSAAQQAIAKRGNPLAMPWNRAGRMAAYSRDMERDADEGGQKLCAAAGYDPMGMSTFLRSLEQSERMRIGYARMPSFLDSHPGSRERAAANAVRASEFRWSRDPLLGDPRAALLKRTEGLPLGERPQTGVFVGDVFIHPDLGFQLRFPSGWLKANTNQAVGARAPEGDAFVYLTADMPPGDPKEVAEKWAAEHPEAKGMKVEESQFVQLGEIEAWRLRLSGSMGRGGAVVSYVTFIPYGSATWRIVGTARARSADQVLGRTLATVRSFRPLTEEERDSVKQTKLFVVKAVPGESIQRLSERSGNVWDPTTTAVSNAVFVDHRFEGGELVKIARVLPYVPPLLGVGG